MLANKLMGGAGAEEKLYVDDVFSAYTYTGNSSTQTITNGIDLAGEGGLVWIKGRAGASLEHWLSDTERGIGKGLITNSTSGQINETTASVSAFNSNGFSLNVGGDFGAYVNADTYSYVSWTFRKAPKFLDVQTKNHTTGSASTVDLSTLGTVGQVIVKRTDSTGNWYVWHGSLTSGYNIYLNTTAAQFNSNAYLSVSGTTLTIASGMPTGSYIVYAFAHDAEEDGIIQCGSYTGTGIAGNSVTLGWEPQYLLIKNASADDYTGWFIWDTMRGLVSGAGDPYLFAQHTTTESASPTDYVDVSATGFSLSRTNLPNASGNTYIYMAIRRPNKPPTSGTQVFLPVSRTGTAAAATVTTPFAPDAIWAKDRYAGFDFALIDKLRGVNKICKTNSAGTEVTDATCVTAFSTAGVVLGTDPNNYFINANTYTYSNWIFKRAPGFLDIVCYTGTGSATTIPHSLGVAPEMLICFRRNVSAASGFKMWHAPLSGSRARNFTSSTLPATDTTAWNSTVPTASVFSVGTNVDTNNNGDTYVAYLFASLAGISKIGTFTGNGASQTINCGFSAGARMVWIFGYTDVTGRIYMFDSARGIVAANDPYFRAESSGAEVSTNDSIDPDSSGFIVNQNATTNLNVTGYGYCYLAIA